MLATRATQLSARRTVNRGIQQCLMAIAHACPATDARVRGSAPDPYRGVVTEVTILDR